MLSIGDSLPDCVQPSRQYYTTASLPPLIQRENNSFCSCCVCLLEINATSSIIPSDELRDGRDCYRIACIVHADMVHSSSSWWRYHIHSSITCVLSSYYCAYRHIPPTTCPYVHATTHPRITHILRTSFTRSLTIAAKRKRVIVYLV